MKKYVTDLPHFLYFPQKASKGIALTISLSALVVACLLPPLPHCVDAGIGPQWYATGCFVLVFILFYRLFAEIKHAFLRNNEKTINPLNYQGK